MSSSPWTFLTKASTCPRSTPSCFSVPRKAPPSSSSNSAEACAELKGKECLTVLDFIGRSSTRFRFDLRYRALTGASRSGVRQEIEEGFPYLPAGCSIQLDRVATELSSTISAARSARRFEALKRSCVPSTEISISPGF